MKKLLTPGVGGDSPPPTVQLAPAGCDDSIIRFDALATRLPFASERTLRDWTRRGILPSIRPPGARKLGFHWPSVIEALQRHSRGGGQ